MNIKLRELVTALEYEELIKIARDLDKGAVHLKKLVDDTMKEKETIHRKVCSECNAEINTEIQTSYTLIFGPSDFRKKATFCALDCLGYFLEQLKELNNITEEEE